MQADGEESLDSAQQRVPRRQRLKLAANDLELVRGNPDRDPGMKCQPSHLDPAFPIGTDLRRVKRRKAGPPLTACLRRLLCKFSIEKQDTRRACPTQVEAPLLRLVDPGSLNLTTLCIC